MGKTVLLTGAAGFIGSHLADALVENYEDSQLGALRAALAALGGFANIPIAVRSRVDAGESTVRTVHCKAQRN